VFPQRAIVPQLEYGNGHMTLVKDHMVVMPGYGSTLAAIALDTGKMAFPVKSLWKKEPPFKGGNVPSPAPDAGDPKVRAALDEFALTVDNVVEFNRGIGRNGDSSYSRTFVDGDGCIWYMNRQARLYRIDPSRGFVSELAGSLDHPIVWTSCSSPYPHGGRIYVRTFGRLACIEDAQGEPARRKALALRRRLMEAAEPIPALIEAAGDEYDAVRRTAELMIGAIGARAVPALTLALADASPKRRWSAAEALRAIGAAAAPAVPALAKVFAGDNVAGVRVQAGRALKAIGNAEGIAEAVVRAVDDPEPEVRKLAVALLVLAGPQGAPAVPTLTRLLREELAGMQRELAGIPDGGIRDSRIRHGMSDRTVLDAFGRMGAAAAPPMVELMQTGDEVAIRWACRVLGRVGNAASAALPALATAFRAAQTPTVRVAVAEALSTVGGGSAAAGALLLEGLRSPDEPVRRASARALTNLKAVDVLAQAVSGGPSAGRLLAIQTLAGMGTAAKAALPALRLAAAGKEPDIAAAAQAAVKAVAP
jgi:HEAT repeat protein